MTANLEIDHRSGFNKQLLTIFPEGYDTTHEVETREKMQTPSLFM